MSGSADLRLLRQELAKTLRLLEEVDAFLRSVEGHELVTLGRTRSTALIVAQILENFYTCVETFLVRVAQCFENNLRPDKWHAELLERMAMTIDGIREAPLSEASFVALRELMRFRHFKRYYFELDYDWTKLDYLVGQYARARQTLGVDLAAFDAFLADLDAAASGPET
jgi:hypothetical protein